MPHLNYRSGFLAVGLMVAVMALEVAVLGEAVGITPRDIVLTGGIGGTALGLAYGIERLVTDRNGTV